MCNLPKLLAAKANNGNQEEEAVELQSLRNCGWDEAGAAVLRHSRNTCLAQWFGRYGRAALRRGRVLQLAQKLWQGFREPPTTNTPRIGEYFKSRLCALCVSLLQEFMIQLRRLDLSYWTYTTIRN